MISYAKSEPLLPLEHHLRDVRNAIQVLLTPARERAFAMLGYSPQQARDLLLAAALLHDWGKGTDQWQSDLLAGRTTPQHSLTGFLACLWAFNINKIEDMPLDLLAVALAVLAHHGQLSDGSFVENTFKGQTVDVRWNEWETLRNALPMRMLAGHPRRGPASLRAAHICSKVDKAKERCLNLPKSTAFRGLYCLILTLLVQADHAASGGYTPSILRVLPPRVNGELTQFQIDSRGHPGQVLCGIAGCGAGKTAAALLRVAELAENNKLDRIVFCLPTRFTTNSLLRDMSDPQKYAYPNSHVGLVHSEALHILRQRAVNSEDDESESSDDPAEVATRSIRYEMPITISTVDHQIRRAHV